MVFFYYYFIYLINSRQSFYVHKANPCCLRYRRWWRWRKRWEWRRYKILFEYVSNLDLIIFLFLFCLQCSFEKLVTEKKSIRGITSKVKSTKKDQWYTRWCEYVLGSRNIQFIETFCTPTTEYHFWFIEIHVQAFNCRLVERKWKHSSWIHSVAA